MMRKLKLYIACSLNGQIARADGSIDWLPDPTGEDYGYTSFYESIDTLVMGYKTYEVCLSFGEWHYKGKKSYVFTRDPNKTTGTEAEIHNTDPVAFVNELKQQEGKDIWLLGGGSLTSQLHNAGLIDEYIIATVPVLLEEGIPLFPELQREQKLKLESLQQFPNGLLLAYYHRTEAA